MHFIPFPTSNLSSPEEEVAATGQSESCWRVVSFIAMRLKKSSSSSPCRWANKAGAFLLNVKAHPDEMKGLSVRAAADTGSTCNLAAGREGGNNNVS